MQNNTPELNQFKQAQAVVQAIITQHNPKIDSSKGSVIRELLVRPYAYVYTYINNLIKNWLNRTSVSYLKNTQDTQDQIADLVASNYFVTRNTGRTASGQLLLSLYSVPSYVYKNTQFNIAGRSFICQHTYIIGNIGQDTQQIRYVNSYVVDGLHKVVIPVTAKQPGSIQIIQGTQAQASILISQLQSAQVFSAISGGSDVQTNSELMRRCQAKCSSTLGSQRAISNCLHESPIHVISCNSIGTIQAGQLRSRYNNMYIPISGAIDTYIKTQNAPARKVIQITSDNITYNATQKCYIFQISSKNTDVAGLYSVDKVRLFDSDDNPISTLSVQDNQYTKGSISFQAIDTDGTYDIDAAGARLSAMQKVVIRISAAEVSNPKAIVQVTYMPSIYGVQRYISDDSKPFLGQSILIKAAIPVKLRLSCNIHSNQSLTQDTLNSIKQTIVNIVNSTPVGQCYLNMADIEYKLHAQYPTIQLRLPYQMHCSILTTQGLSYPVYSNSGVISLNPKQCAYFWDVDGYFLYTDVQYIDIQIV